MPERESPDREPQSMRKLRHDMRTPLGQIIGYSEMLEEEAAEREQHDLIPDLHRIRSAARSLLELLDGVFRPESGASGRAPDPAPSSGPEGSESEPPAVRSAAGRRLLVVDDEARNRDLLARRLERSGYAVETVGDGRSALHRIETGDFDLVLLDVMMPGMNGLEVLQAIRATHPPSALPVVMVTSLDRSDDVVGALELGANDYVTKPFEQSVVLARIETQLNLLQASREIEELARQLEIRNAFMRKTFGRYVSDEVVDSVLESHEGLELNGEKRRLTVLMADLRGFSTLTERLEPDELVRLLNNHLGTMAEIIQVHEGVVDEFIGDAVLAFFGAPVARGNDAERAVACALAMQRGVEQVNERNRERGLPAIEMGVGVATGEMVVGNIGSEKRSKYAVVGSAVNLAARIESYTLGGEILICDETRGELGAKVRIDSEREVQPKGSATPVRIHRVIGMRGSEDLAVSEVEDPFCDLVEEIPVRFALLEGKAVSSRSAEGWICAGSRNGLRIRSDALVDPLRDLRIELADPERVPPDACYAKVVEDSTGSDGSFTVRFTTRSKLLDARVERARPDRSDAL